MKKFKSIYQEKKIYRFYFYEMKIGRSDEEIEEANERERYRLTNITSMRNNAREFRREYETTEQREKRLDNQREYSRNRVIEKRERKNINESTNDEEGSSKKKVKIVDEIENIKMEEANYVSSGKFQQELENNSEIDRETIEVLNLLINLI